GDAGKFGSFERSWSTKKPAGDGADRADDDQRAERPPQHPHPPPPAERRALGPVGPVTGTAVAGDRPEDRLEGGEVRRLRRRRRRGIGGELGVRSGKAL